MSTGVISSVKIIDVESSVALLGVKDHACRNFNRTTPGLVPHRTGECVFRVEDAFAVYNLSTPPPPFICKILKTWGLFYDYVLDL